MGEVRRQFKAIRGLGVHRTWLGVLRSKTPNPNDPFLARPISRIFNLDAIKEDWQSSKLSEQSHLAGGSADFGPRQPVDV